jgi:hypothetical protein
LMTYHGDTDSCKVWFSDIINTCNTFLQTNPTEIIIMSISNEHRHPHLPTTPVVTPTEFVEALDPFLTDTMRYTYSSARLFYTDQAVPKLSAVAGRVVLFRRYECPTPYVNPKFRAVPPGIDAVTGWPDDDVTPSPTTGNPSMMIQDIYKYAPGTEKQKIGRILEFIRDAENLAYADKWFMNFTSTTGGMLPVDIAKQINPAVQESILEILRERSFIRMGTIVMDFPTESMIDLLIAANIDLEPGVVQAHRPYKLALYTQSADSRFTVIGEAHKVAGWNYPQAYVGDAVLHTLDKVAGHMDAGRIYDGDTVRLKSTKFTNDAYIYICRGKSAGDDEFYASDAGYDSGPQDVEWKVEVWDKTPNVTPGTPIMLYYIVRFRNCSTNRLLSVKSESASSDPVYLSDYDTPSIYSSTWKIQFE